MNAGSLPYHLRPNKAVERLLFVDLLDRLDEVLHFEDDYEYVGFGGPQMEDFRVLHERFQNMQMISLEREPEIRKRQEFNCPHTNVSLVSKSSGEYISQFQPKCKMIAWLDYAEQSERVEQIDEFQTLLRNLPAMSLVKITLNANPDNLGSQAKPGLFEERRDRIMEQFGRFLPSDLSEEGLSDEHFPETLLQILAAASREALAGRSGWVFQPLSAFSYRDNRQQMFTATGIVGTKEKIEETVEKSRIKKWHFRNLDWSKPMPISVPELTVKERIHINQILPKCNNDLKAIHKALGFQLDQKAPESEAMLRMYVLFYRHYPHFGRVAF